MKDTDGLVVSAETVDSGFDQDESELGVLVLAVALEVLADGDGLFRYCQSCSEPWWTHARFEPSEVVYNAHLLNQHVEVFWDFWCKTCRMSLCQSRRTKFRGCVENVSRVWDWKF